MFAGERSCGNGFPSSERVRLLQPLLPHPQEGWWSKTHSWSQTSESNPYETAVQDDYIEADPLANMPRGLVLFAGSERHLLSHPNSPPPQAVLEIRLRGSGLSWMQLFPRWDRWESTSWITSTTGSFWPSRRKRFYLTVPCSSAT